LRIGAGIGAGERHEAIGDLLSAGALVDLSAALRQRAASFLELGGGAQLGLGAAAAS
jgi:hypothetical protein